MTVSKVGQSGVPRDTQEEGGILMSQMDALITTRPRLMEMGSWLLRRSQAGGTLLPAPLRRQQEGGEDRPRSSASKERRGDRYRL